MQYIPFVVNETPYCMWDWDIKEIHLRLLDRIDPQYFEHIAKQHANLLDRDEKQYAAMVLRTTYSHALESLFALLCATAQAPGCLLGWLLKYQNHDLYEVTGKIHVGSDSLKIRLPIKHLDWHSLAAQIIVFGDAENSEKSSRLPNLYGELWHRLAEDFLNKDMTSEYNSVKHGLRIHIGGFSLHMGLEPEPGVIPSPDQMRLMVNSTFGSSFYSAEPLTDKLNFRVKEHSVNWDPLMYVHSLGLISLSIENIIGYLKVRAYEVDPSQVKVRIPIDETVFQKPWESNLGFSRFEMNSVIESNSIRPLSKQTILDSYKTVERDTGDSKEP
jgi:hypothetical protein